MVEDLFTTARGYLDEINKICPKFADKRNSIFDKFQKTICSESINQKKKDMAFDNIRAVLDEIEVDCPDAKEFVDKLRELLDSGETLKCGGP